MSLCSECCNLSTLTRIDRAIDEAKEFFNADLHPDNEALTTCMVLLSQVAVRDRMKTTTKHPFLIGYANLRAEPAACR
jgi:hypothetical protein